MKKQQQGNDQGQGQGQGNYTQNPYMNYGYPPYYTQYPQGQQQGGYNPQSPPPIASGGSGKPQDSTMLPVEESYIENILRLNKGKQATVYMTFENNNQWNAKVFKGIIEAAGRDHIILSDPQTGKRYVLLMVYLNYIEFNEPIQYNYPFGMQGQQPLSNYSPR
ncbi:spore coat protein GerQ [Priestia koreensis]|uniref:Spore gernimation protein GerQ n=1 Tax=Priestia koreensis TaxID=284581 RepID=A0A0M0KER0_9BACI|nr:spore coat protein GerQ [Priestia koreensis]KOO37331.1 spore gernimation protein GerQ [Priestia koreensis]